METGDNFNPKTDDTQIETTICKTDTQTEGYQMINEQMETVENITRHTTIPHKHGDKTRTHSTERKQTEKQSRDMSPSDDVAAGNGNVIDMEATKHPTENSPKKNKKTKDKKGSLAIEGQNTKQCKAKILILHVPKPLPYERFYTYKISTLNINGLTAPTKVRMLGDILRTQNIDILCLQEVSTPAINHRENYSTHLNIGTGEGERQ
jgi:hypothetical protein